MCVCMYVYIGICLCVLIFRIVCILECKLTNPLTSIPIDGLNSTGRKKFVKFCRSRGGRYITDTHKWGIYEYYLLHRPCHDSRQVWIGMPKYKHCNSK